ncbi:MAG: SIMPL domain-containing protein [Candidatus Protochlamydia sp.]|nr:SIMPL domain-containing protein [Candidatus Protochlamydia sp.]
MKNKFNILGFALLSFTIIACTYLIMNSIKNIKFGPGNVSVKGCAEKQIHSDFVTWSGVISATGDKEIDAYEKLEKHVEILKKRMEVLNTDLEDVEFSPVVLSTKYELNEKGISTNKIESITLSQEFSLASSDVFLVTKLSQNITSLFKEGITVVSRQPKYFYSKLDELKIAMLGAAATDAYQRAEALVIKSGAQVGRLRAAHQGVFQITPVFSNSVSDYGEFDTSSIDKRIKAVVTMEFAID